LIIKDRVSRNIVGERELFPVIYNPIMNEFFFFSSILIIFGSLMCINSLNPIHSVFWLVAIFFFSFTLLINLNLEFLSFLLIVIYIGAIVILFLFVIMMLDIIQIKKNSNINNIIPIILIILSLFIIKIVNISEFIPYYINSDYLSFNLINHHNFHNLTLYFYSKYFINFLLISIILSIGMIGVIKLTLVNNTNSKKQEIFVQHLRNNSWI
jgi:NADH:ubiquinone oxidoreductase subunit 6 (subunit J)